jgi:hypothetical protein
MLSLVSQIQRAAFLEHFDIFSCDVCVCVCDLMKLDVQVKVSLRHVAGM